MGKITTAQRYRVLTGYTQKNITINKAFFVHQHIETTRCETAFPVQQTAFPLMELCKVSSIYSIILTALIRIV